jgi:hypothetical protein
MMQLGKFFSQKYRSVNLEVTPSLGFTFLAQLLELGSAEKLFAANPI